MKGIILAGGNGTRLLPATAVASKQLLPVYDRPMIFYPLNTLIKAGIKDILMIVSPDHSGNYLNLLGSLLEKYGINISFRVQRSPRGLADAYLLAEDFLDNEPSVMILGDNIFEDDFSDAIKSFEKGGRVFAVKVPDPERFGVVEFDTESQHVISIEEKPASPKSEYAIPGIYIYDGRAVEIAKNLKPSANRGELEIVDMHKAYLEQGELDVHILDGAWFDTGTHDSLLEASVFAKEKKMSEQFDPILQEAIEEHNKEIKRYVALKQ
jgi:glucose-1-phosphate thymidylyltransferase